MSKPNELIYLASPYSHVDVAVRQWRFFLASQVAAELFSGGHLVFSPIAHSHPIAEYGKMTGKGWEYWREFDLLMMQKCDRLLVLQIEGWRESAGVREEVRWWLRNKTYWVPEIVGKPGDVAAAQFPGSNIGTVSLAGEIDWSSEFAREMF